MIEFTPFMVFISFYISLMRNIKYTCTALTLLILPLLHLNTFLPHLLDFRSLKVGALSTHLCTHRIWRLQSGTKVGLQMWVQEIQSLFLYYYLLVIVLLNLALPHPLCHDVRLQQIRSKIMSGLVVFFLKFCISNVKQFFSGFPSILGSQWHRREKLGAEKGEVIILTEDLGRKTERDISDKLSSNWTF